MFALLLLYFLSSLFSVNASASLCEKIALVSPCAENEDCIEQNDTAVCLSKCDQLALTAPCPVTDYCDEVNGTAVCM